MYLLKITMQGLTNTKNIETAIVKPDLISGAAIKYA